MKKLYILLIGSVILLCGCVERYMTEDAWLRDTLFSVEITKANFCRIWMTHDDVSAYCTNDIELCNYALSLLKEHSGDVLVHYFDIEQSDEEAGEWWENNLCGQGIYGTKIWGFDQIMPID